VNTLVRFERDQEVAVITIDNPPVNALKNDSHTRSGMSKGRVILVKPEVNFLRDPANRPVKRHNHP